MPTAWGDLGITNSGSNISPLRTNIPDNIPKISVCIPYNGKFEPEWVEKTLGPLRWKPSSWCNKVVFYNKAPSLPVSRDMLVNQALKTDCDYIFFLDSDIIFEQPIDPNIALDTLYQCMNKDPNSKDGKIASGLYRAKQSQGFSYAMWTKVGEKGFAPIAQWTGNWIEASVTGLGCCLIDTTIFKNIPGPWFSWNRQGEISEDFYFFELSKKFGYNLHIMTDVKLSHLGTLKVKLDGTITISDM